MALLSTHGLAPLSVKGILNSTRPQIMIKCFHDYPTVEGSSPFKLYSSMKGPRNSTVGSTVLHVISSQKGKIE